MRLSDRAPCEGWHVRYEIIDGPAAGLSPNGERAVETPVDSSGRASVEIRQKQLAAGTNRISIQVIRPANASGAAGQRMVVATGVTSKTWTAPDLSVCVAGPPSATVGATLTYQIEVCNPGDLPAKGVTVTDLPSDGLTFLGADPRAESAGRQLQWRLGDLGARQRRLINVQFRAEKAGSVTNRCDAVAAEGLRASHSAATTIGAFAQAVASLDVQITGPQQAAVGDEIRFRITVTNRGPAAAKGLVMRDRFDPGLMHGTDREQTIEKSDLRDLAPGESFSVQLALRVTRPGQLRNTVEVTATNAARACAQACLTAVTPAATP
ncbi:MAG: hypothetical protein ABFC96_09135, partial [Thermoguttaceae bacterium]